MTSKQEFAVVVDIGTTKITALAGEKDESGKIVILGQAKVPSRGIKRGVVINPEEFAGALRTLVTQLEEQVGVRIRTVDVSIAGQGIKTLAYEGVRYIESGLVSQHDVDYLENEARNMPLDSGHKIYHLFPKNYEIGDDPSVTVPVGHEGRKMTARYTLVTAPSSYQESVEKGLSRAGLELGDFVLSPLALSDAVISEEEKDLGVIVVDIGGGTTKMTAFSDGRLVHMAVIPFAGEVITHDIREGCSILQKWAEQLKIQYGQAMGDFAEEEKVVTIPGHNGWEPKEISFRTLAYIIQARLEEIIDSIYYQVEISGFQNQSPQGIVFTGGTSKMVNLLQLVKFRTGMDARLGFSQVKLASTPDLDKPGFLTALGVLQGSLRNREPGRLSGTVKGKPPVEKPITRNSGKRFLSNLGKKVSEQISLIFEEDESN
jgi:cell division protein FtsA